MPVLYPFDRPWQTADAVQIACLLEATAPKLGNVHPGHSFADTHYTHFAASAVVLRDCFADAELKSVGRLVFDAVSEIDKHVGKNTYLGTVLLLSPLAKALALRRYDDSGQALTSDDLSLSARVRMVLSDLTAEDSRLVYEAIRVAQPGGLGNAPESDVYADPPSDLVAAMRSASGVDAVARQYANGFADIFQRLLPWLREELTCADDPLEAICRLQIRWLQHEPDGLIVRKSGIATAEQVQVMAAELNAAATPSERQRLAAELDDFLRADGNKRNPGTTADLIAATLLTHLATT